MKKLKKMTRGFALMMVTAALSFSLAGCGDSKDSGATEAGTTAATESEIPADDPISFVKSGEVYFDIRMGDGVAVSLDGQKMTGTSAALKSGAKVTIDGLDPDGSCDYIVVFATKSQNEVHFQKYIGKGAPNSRLADNLTKQLAFSADKVFISVYEPGGSWDKNLSEALNHFIGQ
jgi:hypothetical protein